MVKLSSLKSIKTALLWRSDNSSRRVFKLIFDIKVDDYLYLLSTPDSAYSEGVLNVPNFLSNHLEEIIHEEYGAGEVYMYDYRQEDSRCYITAWLILTKRQLHDLYTMVRHIRNIEPIEIDEIWNKGIVYDEETKATIKLGGLWRYNPKDLSIPIEVYVIVPVPSDNYYRAAIEKLQQVLGNVDYSHIIVGKSFPTTDRNNNLIRVRPMCVRLKLSKTEFDLFKNTMKGTGEGWVANDYDWDYWYKQYSADHKTAGLWRNPKKQYTGDPLFDYTFSGLYYPCNTPLSVLLTMSLNSFVYYSAELIDLETDNPDDHNRVPFTATIRTTEEKWNSFTYWYRHSPLIQHIIKKVPVNSPKTASLWRKPKHNDWRVYTGVYSLPFPWRSYTAEDLKKCFTMSDGVLTCEVLSIEPVEGSTKVYRVSYVVDHEGYIEFFRHSDKAWEDLPRYTGTENRVIKASLWRGINRDQLRLYSTLVTNPFSDTEDDLISNIQNYFSYDQQRLHPGNICNLVLVEPTYNVSVDTSRKYILYYAVNIGGFIQCFAASLPPDMIVKQWNNIPIYNEAIKTSSIEPYTQTFEQWAENKVLRPAIKIGDEVYSGKVGQIHLNVYNNLPDGIENIHEKMDVGFIAPNGHFFTRDDVTKIFGEEPESAYLLTRAYIEYKQIIETAIRQGKPVPQAIIDSLKRLPLKYGIE